MNEQNELKSGKFRLFFCQKYLVSFEWAAEIGGAPSWSLDCCLQSFREGCAGFCVG